MSVISGLDLPLLKAVPLALRKLADMGIAEARMAVGHEQSVEDLLDERLLTAKGRYLVFQAGTQVQIEPNTTTLDDFAKRLQLNTADRVVWSALFTPTDKAPFANRMLVQIHEQLTARIRTDRATSKMEDKGESAALVREMRDDFEADVRKVAGKLIYSRVRIFTPKEGDTSFYICKTRSKTEAYKKAAGDAGSLFRWFRTYIWDSDYHHIYAAVRDLRTRWPQFPEVSDPEKFLQFALDIMDKDDEANHLLSEDQMSIITDNQDDWAWGVVTVPPATGAGYSAWTEWEGKFACQPMVKWWRAWLAQLFNPKCASGLVRNRVRSAGNLGLVWVKSPGKEGSSVVISLLARLLGPNVTAAIRLAGDHFEMASYYGKRCVFADDIRAPRILYRGTFHSIITGGEQSIEEKHQRPFRGWINCSVVCTSNSAIIANRYAVDQMRRLLYIVLNRSTGPKDDEWGQRLDEQFGDYMVECRKVLAELHEKYGTADIFHHYEDPEIAEHYAATLRSDELTNIHDVVVGTAKLGKGESMRNSALFQLYRRAYQLVRGQKLDDADYEEIVLRDLQARHGVVPRGNTLHGISTTVTAEEIRRQLLGEEEGDD